MLPHYRPDAINNEAGREKQNGPPLPLRRPPTLQPPRQRSELHIWVALMSGGEERGRPWGDSKKWHRSLANINSSPKNHYAGGGIMGARCAGSFL